MCFPEQDSMLAAHDTGWGWGQMYHHYYQLTSSPRFTHAAQQSSVWQETMDMDAEDLRDSKPGSCHSCHQCGQQPGPAQQGVEQVWQWRGEDCKQVLLPRRPARPCLPLTICLVTSQHSGVAALVSANSLHESCLCPAHVYTLIVWNKRLYSCHPAGVGVGMSNESCW